MAREISWEQTRTVVNNALGLDMLPETAYRWGVSFVSLFGPRSVLMHMNGGGRPADRIRTEFAKVAISRSLIPWTHLSYEAVDYDLRRKVMAELPERGELSGVEMEGVSRHKGVAADFVIVTVCGQLFLNAHSSEIRVQDGFPEEVIVYSGSEILDAFPKRLILPNREE